MAICVKVIQFCLILLLSVQLSAQDIHFSQFDASQMFLNPALTGNYTGDWSAGIQHRKQWKSIGKPFISNTVFFDRHFYYFSRQINGGIIWTSDRAGSSALTTNRIHLSISYPLKSGRSIFSIGLQPGISLKSINRNLTYPTQFNDNTGYFDPNLQNRNDNGVEESLLYGKTNQLNFDLNAGIFWQMKLPKLRPAFGIAFFHLNQPSESFNSTNNRQSMRLALHGNVLWKLNKGLYLKPGFQYQSMPATNMTNIGALFGKKFNGKNKSVKDVFAGAFVRSGFSRNEDAIYPVAGIQYLNWRIGMSYDYNISGLNVATQTKGAYEISIVYTAPSSIPKHTTIPCERY